MRDLNQTVSSACPNCATGDGGRAVKVTDIYSGAVIRATRGGGAELVTVYFEDSGVSLLHQLSFRFLLWAHTWVAVIVLCLGGPLSVHLRTNGTAARPLRAHLPTSLNTSASPVVLCFRAGAPRPGQDGGQGHVGLHAGLRLCAAVSRTARPACP